MIFSLTGRLAAECLGTGFLVTAEVGSSTMGERLSGGNVTLALLGNTLLTGSMLVAVILAVGPISGAHFNQAVSLVMSLRKDHPWRELFPYAGPLAKFRVMRWFFTASDAPEPSAAWDHT